MPFPPLLLLSPRTNSMLKPHVTGDAERPAPGHVPPKTLCPSVGVVRQGRYPVSTKLHVGNLGRWMTDDELNALFAPAGTVVRAHVLTHGQTGTSRGFGHVEMGAEDEAQNAVAQLHRAAIAGLRLIVRPVEKFPAE